MLLIFIWILIVAACVGFLYNEGLWSNAVRLINVVLAALLAMNFYEPLARYLTSQFRSFTYFCDFIAVWVVFAFAIVFLSEITNRLSKVKVKFLNLADRIGSVAVAVWIGWIMVCFTATTMHMAPLARSPFRGSFEPEARAASTLSPEMLWLGFTQKISKGAFAKGEEPGFDPKGEFLPRYATRRAKLESYVEQTSAVRVRPEQWTQHY